MLPGSFNSRCCHLYNTEHFEKARKNPVWVRRLSSDFHKLVGHNSGLARGEDQME